MPHRDDREAMRERIDALERDLADAKEEAARARAEANASKAALPKPAAPAPAPRKRRHERKRKPPAPEPAPSAPGPWRGRRTYKIGVAIIAGAVYGTGAAILLLDRPDDDTTALVYVMLGGAAAMGIGVGILGLFTRAPEAVGGALITLLVSALALGAIAIAGSEGIVDGIVPQALHFATRVGISAVAVGIGMAIAATWAPDAASSPIGGR